MEEEWEQLEKIIKLYSPDYFNSELCTFNLYKKVATFISTRCFGWGLPTTFLVPIADSFNHSSKFSNNIDLVNKRLHLAQNKIYAYHFNFDGDTSKGIDDQYDKSTSKLSFNVKRLFKEDEKVKDDPELQKLIEGEKLTNEDTENRYDEKEVFERFKNLMNSEIDNPDEFETEEHKRQKFPNHGLELWGIGYVSSDYEQDDDSDDDEDEEESVYNEDLKEKIMTKKCAPDDLTMDEFDTVSYNTRLREIFSYRWWEDNDDDNYFVMVNKNRRTIKAGEQIYYNYGKRTNAYLFEK